MSTPLQQRSGYRPEIQGIRTIGALLVAVFHIWAGRVSGGVDVFFVISGFLITGSLYKELQRSDTIAVLAFWGRIARRIAPMAYLILALTLLAALVWMPASRQGGFLLEVLYSALHLENLKLMMNAVDYLAREEAPSPVQQFWALSVQVQFYAVWPFLLLATALAAKKLRQTVAPYLAVLAAVFLASLAYSVIATRLDPAPAYFNTLARVWEFALGGLLALALPHLRLPPRLRLVAGWLGLALVVSCGFVVPASVHYPGYVALWPTLGAALVLVSGGGGVRFGVERVLGWKPLVALGEISFSFYLWHWPVLIFYMLVRGQTQVGPLGGLVVIALALGGAYGAHRWLEQPIQRSAIGRHKVWHVHAMATTLMLPVIIAATVWSVALEAANNRHLSTAEYPGGSIPASIETAMKPGIPLHPAPAAAKRDLAKAFVDKCHQNQRKADVIACDYGITHNPTKTVALVGGSHSAHWLPTLEALAQQYGWRIVSITKSACPFEVNTTRKKPCIQWNDHVIEYLAQLRPDVVFTTSTRPYRGRHVEGEKKRREFIPDGYLTQWKRLAERGVTVIAVRDNPWVGSRILDCVEANISDIGRCARPRDQLMDDVDPTAKLETKPSNVAFVDLTDRFCDPSRCFPVNGNMLIYRDGHHMTASFARSLASTLGKRMKQVRPDLFLDNSDT